MNSSRSCTKRVPFIDSTTASPRAGREMGGHVLCGPPRSGLRDASTRRPLDSDRLRVNHRRLGLYVVPICSKWLAAGRAGRRSMIAKAGVRFWAEVMLAVVTGALGALTLVWQEWIEAVFRVDPDGGDGSLEGTIAA